LQAAVRGEFGGLSGELNRVWETVVRGDTGEALKIPRMGLGFGIELEYAITITTTLLRSPNLN
jgi:hypothetical protein